MPYQLSAVVDRPRSAISAPEGLTAQRLEAKATITFEKAGEHFAITKSHLDLLARVPGAKQAAFDAAVRAAETGCPVSKLFRAEISVDARLDATP